MSITAKMVKDLREITGAGMMNCKEALTVANGDMEKAVDELRKKGAAKSIKRADRETSEGVVVCHIAADNKSAAMLALTCETDFVARNDDFGKYAQELLEHLRQQKSDNLDEFLATEFNDMTLTDHIAQQTGTIGERIAVKQICYLQTTGYIEGYVHSNRKIGTFLDVDTDAEYDKVAGMMKDITMHIAAMNPLGMDENDVEKSVIERETDIYKDQLRNEGKKEDLIEKIVKGKINKYIKENTLLAQPFVKDDKMSVGELIKNTAKEIGEEISVKQFVRFQIGH